MEEPSSSKTGETEEEAKKKKKPGLGKSSPASVWDCGSPLYDSFELASLCHALDRRTMKLPYLLQKISPGSVGRAESGEREAKITDAIGLRRWSMKKEKPGKRRSGAVWPAIFRAVAFWKKPND